MIEVLKRACAFCDDSSQSECFVEDPFAAGVFKLHAANFGACHESGKFPMGMGRVAEGRFIRFRDESVNRPDLERAGWILKDLCRYAPNDRLGDGEITSWAGLPRRHL